MSGEAQSAGEDNLAIPVKKRAFVSIPLYLGFAATGVGVALPGALLPALLLRWHLGDEQGGRLFLMAWIGSSLGALMVRGSLRKSLLLGSMAVAAGAAALTLCPARAAYVCMALYGLGLGLSMTSISLIRQREAGAESGTVLVRLNLLWAIGAFTCPSLAAPALRNGDIRPLLLCLAVSFLLLAAWAFLQKDVGVADGAEAFRPWSIFHSVPIGLILITILVPGIEAAAGGWLTTYARREGHGIAEAVAAPTCFWAGLLLSRLFWSVFDRWLPASWTVRASALVMSAASILLVASGRGPVLLIAAFCLGFGIGPVYPLLLASTLRFQRSGAIFFLAGVGAACLPWLTGVVSAERHSLQVGLAVPMAATVLLAAMSILLPLKRWSDQGRD